MALRTADGRSLDEAAAAAVTEDKYSVIFNAAKGGENENKGLEDGERGRRWPTVAATGWFSYSPPLSQATTFVTSSF